MQGKWLREGQTSWPYAVGAQHVQMFSTVDLVGGARILSSCWFVTTLGVAVIQMRLLAQAWQQSHLAAWTAGLASCWILGSLQAAHLDARWRSASRPWGISFALCALLCVRFLSASNLTFPPLPFGSLTRGGELAVMAFLLGMVSTAWLDQRRPWPMVDERISLARGLLSTMVGLSVVWLIPDGAGTVGLICVSPLLVLDFWPQAKCPLPTPGRRVDNWYDTSEGADRWQLQLQRHPFPFAWRWSYLARSGRLSLVLLAGSVSAILGGVWSAAPTPFASGLSDNHATGLLAWLVLSQLVALAIGVCCFRAARGMLEEPDRLIPPKWLYRAWSIAVGALFLLACGLLALGLPSLQALWCLCGSIAIYTLAGATWGMLLPRLKPDLRTPIFAQRHLAITHVNAQLRKSRLAYERAQEKYVHRLLLTMEGILTALLAPLVGLMIDRWGVDDMLVTGGLALITIAGLFCLLSGLRIRKRKRQQNAAVESGEQEGAIELSNGGDGR